MIKATNGGAMALRTVPVWRVCLALLTVALLASAAADEQQPAG
ncbi:hypothetical protein OHA72_33710 [Dactylosporangium sp. NBC_01737]|nr:hypothetical protein OHA72_33710 [Dactylosporangium sp. NBC_01737]